MIAAQIGLSIAVVGKTDVGPLVDTIPLILVIVYLGLALLTLRGLTFMAFGDTDIVKYYRKSGEGLVAADLHISHSDWDSDRRAGESRMRWGRLKGDCIEEGFSEEDYYRELRYRISLETYFRVLLYKRCLQLTVIVTAISILYLAFSIFRIRDSIAILSS